MRGLFLLLSLVLAVVVQAQHQNGADVLALAAKELPPCALQCTLVTVGKSACQLTDVECIKTNEQLLSDLTVCVKSSCSIRESLKAKKFLQHMIGAPIRDNRKLGTYTCLIVGGVAVLAYILRVITRLPMFGASWGLDDWVITAATLIIIPLSICAEILNRLGLGQDMWEVPQENIGKILEIFYYTEMLYLAATGLTKIAILLFYLRIFPQKQLRHTIYVTVALCVAYTIACVTASGLQCLPIHYAWDRWDGENNGKCINLNALAWASAAINIVLDLIVIVLPMKEISTLSLSRRRKFGVMLMFLLGGFVTLISILRLKYLVQFSHTENVTWDYLPIGIWSAVEAHVGLIVACLPAIRSLVRYTRDRIFPKPVSSYSFTEDNTRSRSNKKNSKKTPDSSVLESLTGAKAADGAFTEQHDYEMKTTAGRKESLGTGRISGDESSSKSLNHFSSSPEEIQPITINVHAPSGILVQTEYSVDRGSMKSRSGGHAKLPWETDSMDRVSV